MGINGYQAIDTKSLTLCKGEPGSTAAASIVSKKRNSLKGKLRCFHLMLNDMGFPTNRDKQGLTETDIVQNSINIFLLISQLELNHAVGQAQPLFPP